MAHVRTDGLATVIAYPYDIRLLGRDNPNVSFPVNVTDALLAERNVFPVYQASQGDVDPFKQDVREGTPVQDSEGRWIQTWIVTDVSAEEEANRRAAAYANAEAATAEEAKRLLAASDKAIIEAFESFRSLHPDFIAYRAALRDVGSLPGYPFVTAWPVEPESALGTELNIIGKFDQMVLANQNNGEVGGVS